MGETERVGYEDWDNIIKNSKNQLERIKITRRTMNVAEECEKNTIEFATKERSKYPEPEPETMAEDEKPEETPESTEESDE